MREGRCAQEGEIERERVCEGVREGQRVDEGKGRGIESIRVCARARMRACIRACFGG